MIRFPSLGNNRLISSTSRQSWPLTQAALPETLWWRAQALNLARLWTFATTSKINTAKDLSQWKLSPQILPNSSQEATTFHRLMAAQIVFQSWSPQFQPRLPSRILMAFWAWTRKTLVKKSLSRLNKSQSQHQFKRYKRFRRKFRLLKFSRQEKSHLSSSTSTSTLKSML